MSKNNEVKIKIQDEEDFINYPKFSNSLKKLMAKYPDGVEDEIIAKALMIPLEEVQGRFASYISEARKRMGVDDGEL
jgi:hypothetical protein